MPRTDCYNLDIDQVLQHFKSSKQGLNSQQAKQRLLEHGANTIPEKGRRSLLLILLGQFTDFMILVLIIAAIISGVVGELQDTLAILFIVLLNAIIGTVQAFRAERAVAALKKMSAPKAP